MPRSRGDFASHGDWVARSTPEAPPALIARVKEVLAAHPEWDEVPLADALTRAGESLLAGVMGKGEAEQRERSTALDLLAADACVTWAFEAASEGEMFETLPERARSVTARILASAGPSGGAS